MSDDSQPAPPKPPVITDAETAAFQTRAEILRFFVDLRASRVSIDGTRKVPIAEALSSAEQRMLDRWIAWLKGAI